MELLSSCAGSSEAPGGGATTEMSDVDIMLVVSTGSSSVMSMQLCSVLSLITLWRNARGREIVLLLVVLLEVEGNRV
jgi:hypothetical protein